MTGMARARPYSCVLSLLACLFCLQGTFAGGYTVPLLVGGAAGVLAVVQALGLRRQSGWKSWAWSGVAGLALLNLVTSAPRYVWMVSR